MMRLAARAVQQRMHPVDDLERGQVVLGIGEIGCPVAVIGRVIMADYAKKAAKRLFGIPEFSYYALSDGLSAIFTRHPGKPHLPPRPPRHPQMELNLA